MNIGEVTAGTHTLSFGAYNNKKTAFDEITDLLIDNVVVTGILASTAPAARDDSVTTDEDTPLSINVLADNGQGPDIDFDGELIPSTISVLSGPNHGSLSNQGNGVFLYTPDSNYHGPDTFTYNVEDNAGAQSNVATVQIMIRDVNDAPVAREDSIDTLEDTPTVIQVFIDNGHGIDFDTDGSLNTASLTAIAGPIHGELVPFHNGSFLYLPDKDFSGTDSFTYSVQDDEGAISNEANVTIMLAEVNDPPVARPDVVETAEDTDLIIDPLQDNGSGPDTDVDGTLIPFTTTVVTAPTHGSLTPQNDGTFVYTPNFNFFGSDQFTYTVRDNDGVESNTATVMITVNEVNDPPHAQNDEVETNEDTPKLLRLGDDNGNGPDGDEDGSLHLGSFDIVTHPANGIVYSLRGGLVLYVPKSDFHGTDQFTYTVNDDDGATSNEATATIQVHSVNDAPLALHDVVETSEDTDLIIQPLLDNGNGADMDLDGGLVPATATVVAGPSHGNLTNQGDGTFLYSPSDDFFGNDEFIYTVHDDDGSVSNPATVSINVLDVNDVPIARDDLVATGQTFPLLIDVLIDNGNGADADVDGNLEPETTTVTDAPDNGSLENQGSGVFLYTPDPGFLGVDAFQYTIRDDDNGVSAAAVVTITVVDVNLAPIAKDDNVSTTRETPLTIDLLADNGNGIDQDPDANLLPDTASVATGPTNGAVVNLGDGIIRYTPNNDFHGSDSFTYTVSDEEGAVSNVATVTITVHDVNDPPIAHDDAVTIDEDTAVTIDVLSDNGSGPDQDRESGIVPSTVAAVSEPVNGTIANNGDGTFLYTPNPEFNGVDTFTYNLQDNEGAPSNVATVSITVLEVNDSPIARDDDINVDEDTAVTIHVLTDHGNGPDVDVDGILVPASVTATSLPANGTLVNQGDGTLVYTPHNNYHGLDLFTYIVDDDEGATSNLGTVTISVLSVNDLPIANDDVVSTDQNTPVLIHVLDDNGHGADNDIDGTLVASSTTVIAGPTNGTVVNLGGDSLQYTPNTNFAGSDSFTYGVQDNQGGLSNPATVTITVNLVEQTLMEADFEGGTDGFVYIDDAFRGTQQPIYASGLHLNSGGRDDSGGLSTSIGGIESANVFNMSGGWQTEFTLNATQHVAVYFDYNLTQAANYENDEFSEALFSIDGNLYGHAPLDYVAQIFGNGTGGGDQTTGWENARIEVGLLSAGSHTLTLGAFNNKKTAFDEVTNILLDNVRITTFNLTSANSSILGSTQDSFTSAAGSLAILGVAEDVNSPTTINRAAASGLSTQLAAADAQFATATELGIATAEVLTAGQAPRRSLAALGHARLKPDSVDQLFSRMGQLGG